MRSAAITRCIVSTDSAEIADVARAHGGDVPFLRPAELAADETPMAPVLQHALATVEQAEGAPYDALVLLDPTSPARDPADITAALELLAGRPDWDGVVSVSAPTFQPVWVGVKPRPATPRGSSATSPRAPGSPAASNSTATCASTATSTSGAASSSGGCRRPGWTRACTG